MAKDAKAFRVQERSSEDHGDLYRLCHASPEREMDHPLIQNNAMNQLENTGFYREIANHVTLAVPLLLLGRYSTHTVRHVKIPLPNSRSVQ
jgi:hypothetical protein